MIVGHVEMVAMLLQLNLRLLTHFCIVTSVLLISVTVLLTLFSLI